jgi:hypothetical protein
LQRRICTAARAFALRLNARVRQGLRDGLGGDRLEARRQPIFERKQPAMAELEEARLRSSSCCRVRFADPRHAWRKRCRRLAWPIALCSELSHATKLGPHRPERKRPGYRLERLGRDRDADHQIRSQNRSQLAGQRLAGQSQSVFRTDPYAVNPPLPIDALERAAGLDRKTLRRRP